MALDWFNISFLIVCGFFGAFINAVVGGGGLITVPALLAVGLPPAVAIGTNKLAASLGNLTSMLAFMRAGKVNIRLLLPILPLVFASSMSGAFTVHQMSPEILQPLIIVMLIAVLVYSLAKKNLGQLPKAMLVKGWKKKLAYTLLIIIGFYDGFFGPGTGSFMIFVLLFMGFDFVNAAGSSKLLNLTSNTAALLMFMGLGSVNYSYGIIMALAMIAGAYVGTRVALSKGTGFVRLLFIAVTSVLIIKNIYDFYGG